jgi:hypothetical protein
MERIPDLSWEWKRAVQWRGTKPTVLRERAGYSEGYAVESERPVQRLSHGDHRACEKNNFVQQNMRRKRRTLYIDDVKKDDKERHTKYCATYDGVYTIF